MTVALGRPTQRIPAPVPPPRGVTARAVVLGLLLVPADNFLIIHMELVRDGIFPTVITLLFTVVFLLFLLTLLNTGLLKLAPRLAFSHGELLTVYSLLAVGAALAGCDVGQTLVCLVGAPAWYASPANHWEQQFNGLLPRRLTIADRDVLTGFYEGSSTLYTPEHLAAWLPVMGIWLAFIAVMVLTMFCLNALIRRQWIEAERLSFPVVSLPLHLTTISPPFLANRVFWWGFGIAGAIDVINGLNYHYPQVPAIPCKIVAYLNEYTTTQPWNAIGWFPLTLYPFAIGLGYLMPLDLSFSCWFFFWVWKVERVAGAALGYPSPGFSSYCAMEQMGGVWIGMFLFALWMARRHLRAMGDGIRRGTDSESRALRFYAVGAAAGTLAMMAFCRAIGMSPLVGAAYVAIYLALSMTITRIRAELGPPSHDMYGAGPDHILPTLFGSSAFTHRELGGISMLYWLNRESYRSHVMPHHLESQKLAHAARLEGGRLWIATYAAALVGAVAAVWIVLHVSYQYGVEGSMRGPARWFATEGFQRLDRWLTEPQERSLPGTYALGLGLLLSLGLLFARTRWVWFPLHPVGYAVSSWWAIHLFWLPLLLSWIVKVLVLRYLGLTGYRRALPFFIGLVVGEYVVGTGWQLIGIIGGFQAYAFWV